MPTDPELELTIVVTVVGGRECVRSNLTVVCPQVRFDRSEVIVPYDRWSSDIGSLAAEFPKVNFHFTGDLGLLDPDEIGAADHRLYDRRRATALRLSRGRIVLMTEDQAMPAEDWVSQILAAHEQPFQVIGGAVECGVHLPMNRALYFCDFGRYGRPFQSREVSYLSDVNLAYKREALVQTQSLWWEEYHETTVNWALAALGNKLFIDERPVVYQCRPRISFLKALKERVEWGRTFAATRAEHLAVLRRVLFAAGTLLLPVALVFRVLKNMRRQRQGKGNIISTLPIVSVLVVFWSIGEMIGYLTTPADPAHKLHSASTAADACPEPR